MPITVPQRLQTRFHEISVTSALVAGAAVVLFLSGFAFNGGNWRILVNNLLCGGIAAPMAFGVFANPNITRLTAALGAWVAASPFVLQFTGNSLATWCNVVLGAAIVLFSFRSGETAEPFDTGPRGYE